MRKMGPLAVLTISVLTWLGVAFLLYYIVEPFLRLRCDITLAKDNTDREFVRVFGSIFWPLAIFVYPLCVLIIFPFFRMLMNLEKTVDEFWAKKPEPKAKPEREIDQAKSDYRNIKLKR